MSKFPLVSIIIPSYNGEKFIAKAIKSVLLQTYKNWELIIIIDGSNDGSEKIISNFKDKRIKYFKIEHSGSSKTRNTGINKSKGNYIAFLDQDDVWLPEKLSIQMEYIDRFGSDIGLIYCSNYKLEDGRIIIGKRKSIKEEYIIRDYNYHGVILPSSALLRRETFNDAGLFDEKLELRVDHDLWIRISRRYKFLYLRKPLFIYVMHPEQIHRNKKLAIKSREIILNKYRNSLEEMRGNYNNWYFKNGHELCELGEIKQGRDYLKKAIKTTRFPIKPIFTYMLTFFGSRVYRLFFHTKRTISKKYFIKIHPQSDSIVKYYQSL